MTTPQLYTKEEPRKPKPKAEEGIKRPTKNLKHSKELVIADPNKLVRVQEGDSPIWGYVTEDPLKHVELIGYWDQCIGSGIRVNDRIDLMSTDTDPPTYALLAVREIKPQDAPDRVVTRTLQVYAP